MKVIDDIHALYDRLRSGDRGALARAITLVESRQREHRDQANALLDLCLDRNEDTFRFTVSGAPGVGKSTFIESLGQHITANGQKLAVLAIDPSSSLGGGAILGDKTRMAKLSQNPDVFIRPTASGGALGGVADRTREVIALCESAGYRNICVETVGVGQSEYEAYSMTDMFLLLVQPGGGDDLQGIKKGIVELADFLIVNKSDGAQLALSRQTRQFYLQAARTFAGKEHGIPVEVINCSAISGEGIAELWQRMQDFRTHLRTSGFLASRRRAQDLQWFDTRTDRIILSELKRHDRINTSIEKLRKDISNAQLSVSSAVMQFEETLRNILR